MAEKRPCEVCGYRIAGGNFCGDCREYGPPQGWRWRYDPVTDRHVRVEPCDCPPVQGREDELCVVHDPGPEEVECG